MMPQKKKTGGGSWFRMLPVEMDMITSDDLISPEHDPEPNENVVGEADNDIKKLYTIMIRTEEKATRALVDARYERNKEERERLRFMALKLKSQADVIREILFSVIRDTFDLWDHNIGIRAGYTIVTYHEKKKGDFRDFLRGIGLAPPDEE